MHLKTHSGEKLETNAANVIMLPLWQIIIILIIIIIMMMMVLKTT